MSTTRSRRGGSPADGRRTARPPRTGATGPVRGLPSRRPGQRRTVRRPERVRSATRQAGRRPVFTGRAVLLGALLLLLALTLAAPMRQYLEQRADLAALAAEGRALEQRKAELADQVDLQRDDGWVEREARERLTYVRPGDRLVVVVDGEARGEVPGPLPPLTGAGPEQPWYDGLLESLEVADGDRPPAGEVPPR